MIVGLDVTTTGVKAIAIDENGEVLERAEESYRLSTPQPGWAEQDPDDWVRAAEQALSRFDATSVGPDARAAFVGLSRRHDRGALVRAVLEGVASGLRDSLELLLEVSVQPETGRVSGGGARSQLWRNPSIAQTSLSCPA
jgi:sugar (pentulose or hexulose) kinase